MFELPWQKFTVADYTPCFTSMPADWAGRWTLLREFIRRWHGLPLGPVAAVSSLAYRQQQKLNRPLPPSMLEYMALLEELHHYESVWALPDGANFEPIPGQNAISLFVDENAWSAVKEEHLHLDDPPVEKYLSDYDRTDDGRFSWYLTEYLSITEFVFDTIVRRRWCHPFSSLNSATHHFKSESGLLDQLSREFPNSCVMGNCHIFEQTNITAWVSPLPSDDDLFLQIHVFRPVSLQELPPCLVKLHKETGELSNLFTEDA